MICLKRVWSYVLQKIGKIFSSINRNLLKTKNLKITLFLVTNKGFTNWLNSRGLKLYVLNFLLTFPQLLLGSTTKHYYFFILQLVKNFLLVSRSYSARRSSSRTSCSSPKPSSWAQPPAAQWRLSRTSAGLNTLPKRNMPIQWNPKYTLTENC